MKTKHKKSNISQLTVPTPKWLQREMLRDLKKAAKSRISPDRVICAQQILDELKLENPKAADVASADIPVQTVKSHVPAMNHQSIPDRRMNNNHQGIVGKVVQCVQRYLGRLWKK